MEKFLFGLGILVAIFPLNWIRILLFGELPPGNSPQLVFELTSVVVAIDLAIFWVAFQLRKRRLIREGCPEDRLSFRESMKFEAQQGEARRQELARQQAAIVAAQQAELERARTGPLALIQPTNAILHKNENAYAVLPAALCEVKTVGYSGGSRGVSLRVAKGVTLRTGGYKGSAQKAVVVVATGELVATNERVMFAGDKKSIAIKLGALVSIQRSGAEFVLSESGKSYSFRINPTRQAELFETILRRMVAEI